MISHESIYRFIYGQIRRTNDYSWRHYLPRGKSKRGWRGRKGGSPASFITLRRPLYRSTSHRKVRSTVSLAPPTIRFDPIGALTHERPYKPHMVDLGGFEPPASSMPLRRAPNCATGPRLGRAGGMPPTQDRSRIAPPSPRQQGKNVLPQACHEPLLGMTRAGRLWRRRSAGRRLRSALHRGGD